jgi:hypothetical protein
LLISLSLIHAVPLRLPWSGFVPSTLIRPLGRRMEPVMILRTDEIQPGDMRHLHCSDPRLKKEVARAQRIGFRPIKPTTPLLSPEASTLPRPRPAA